MALNFTNDQIKELTGQVLAAPDTIASLNNDKAAAVARKNDFLFLDQANEVYTDHFHNLMVQYHAELQYLNGQIRTNYNLADIDSSGRLAPGNPHFPFSPVWAQFPPKKLDSNEGIPFGVLANTETTATTEINDKLDLLLNGFSDGAVSDTTETVFTGSVVEVLNGGFAPGERVIFVDGSNFLFGTITAVAAMPVTTGMQLITVTIIDSSAGYGGIGIGATVDNNHPGFSNFERETLSDPFMNSLKNQVDAQVPPWEVMLNAEKSALLLNDPTDPAEQAEISTAISNIDSTLSTLATWKAFPSLGVGTSRFGDTNLPILTGVISTRLGQLATRVTEIGTRLGSIAQNPDGTFTGTGQYFNFFDSSNFRINKASGTLRNYYQMDLIISVFDQQIATLVALQARDSASFSIFEFAATANGTTTVQLVDATGLAVLQTVKVMSNTQPVFDAVIQSIALNTVVLDLPVPATYTIGDKARLVFVN